MALWSWLNLGRNVEWDLGLRIVDRLAATLQRIPGYAEMESRIAWKPNRNCEVTLVGNNLLHAHHPEFNPVVIFGRDARVDRSIYAKVTIRF